jgi:Flp pilus assembly protein TadD
MKRVEEAKRQFEEIIAVDPNIPGAWCNLAVCCSILGQMKEAMKAITTAVDIFPENSSVAYMWCDLRRRQKGGDPKLQMTQQEADRLHHELHSELYKLRVENDSSNAELWSALGEEYLALDDFANAETAFLKATEYGTTHATDWYNLAFFPHQRGEAKKVVVLTEKAIALGFADPGLWGLRGIAFSQIGNLFEARRCLQNSVSLDVDNPSNIEILRDIEAQIERIRSSPEFRVLTVTGHCGKCGGLLSVDMTVIGYECSCPNCKDPVPASPLLGEIRSAFAQTGIDVPPD